MNNYNYEYNYESKIACGDMIHRSNYCSYVDFIQQ